MLASSWFRLTQALRPFQSRTFSASSVLEKYKLKSHSGTKKRWKSLPNGTFKRGKTGHRHKNEHKSAAQKNGLGVTAYSHGAQTVRLNKALLPYGS